MQWKKGLHPSSSQPILPAGCVAEQFTLHYKKICCLLLPVPLHPLIAPPPFVFLWVLYSILYCNSPRVLDCFPIPVSFHYFRISNNTITFFPCFSFWVPCCLFLYHFLIFNSCSPSLARGCVFCAGDSRKSSHSERETAETSTGDMLKELLQQKKLLFMGRLASVDSGKNHQNKYL